MSIPAPSLQVPLPVVEAKVSTDTGPNGEPLLLLAAGRKDYTLRCDTVGDRHAWITALQSSRELGIKQQLGHAVVPEEEVALNKVVPCPRLPPLPPPFSSPLSSLGLFLFCH